MTVAIILVIATTAHAQQGWSVKIGSRAGWKKTPLHLVPGNKYHMWHEAGGWTVDYRNFTWVGPEGYPPRIDKQIYQGCKIVPQWPYAKLIGKVGTKGSIFKVGLAGNGTRTFTARSRGYLYLRIHDGDACLGDNRGSVGMRIKRELCDYGQP